MLDIHWIRDHAAEVQAAAKKKGIEVSVEECLRKDDQRKELLREVEGMRKKRNEGSAQVAHLLQAGKAEEAELSKSELKQLNERIAGMSQKLDQVNSELERLMMLIPNVPSPDTPEGNSDADNIEVRSWGVQPEWSFDPLDHVDLGIRHDMIDVPRGVKVGGSRSYYLKGMGLLLHRAVQQLALDLLLEHDFIPFDVPMMVREENMINTGFFPTGKDQAYAVQDESLWMVGTSEVPLVSYYGGEIVDVEKPIKLAGVSNCFRSEVGSAGRDVRGLYRVHQFAKVEMVVICKPDPALSEQLLQEITSHSEHLLQALELPYRVMAVCAGDMSQKTYKQYDIETWMPSRANYGETHSASDLHSFQARRSNIRCRDEQGKLQYCYTLNNTAVASPRILIPLLENHQREDGSIYVPPALRKYLGGRAELIPQN